MRRVFEKKKKKHHYATLKKNGYNFELLINPKEAIKYRQGSLKNVRDALEIEQVFSDARSGELAANLEENFGTSDIRVIADEIIKTGEIRLTTSYKKELKEQKQKEVLSIISKRGIDPRTGKPIPISRIKLALEQVNFRFDPFKKAKEQVPSLLEALRPVIPISFEQKKVQGTVPAKYAGKCSGVINKFGKVIKSEWKNDGSWNFVIQMPGGLTDEFIKEMTNITHGEININLR